MDGVIYYILVEPIVGERIASRRVSDHGVGPHWGLNFLTGRKVRMVIDNEGKVGIGTDKLTRDLTVNGTVLARDGIHIKPF